MANTNSPFGFWQRQGTGASPTFEMTENGNGGIDYNTGAIYYGDPVVRVGSGDGTLTQAAGSAGGSTVTMAGVFVGVKYLSTSQKRTIWGNYWPGSDVTSANQTSISAWYINDPNAQFVAQSDSTGLTQAGVGSNFDFAIGTGTAANGLSGAYLLHTGVTTAAYPWRLNQLVLDPPGIQGSASGAYNYGIVSFNNQEYKNATAVNT